MDFNISEGAIEFFDRYRWLFDSDGNSLSGYLEDSVHATKKKLQRQADCGLRCLFSLESLE